MSNKKNDRPPWALNWRSNTLFIVATVAVGLFTDLFLYGLVVPVLPFVLRSRLGIPDAEIQSYVSWLLAAYAGASVLSALPVGWAADRTSSRRAPFLSGLAALLIATLMLALGNTVAWLVVARVLQGISAAVVWTIGLAMVLDTVGPENLGKVVGSIFSFISIGQLLAPVIGGILYEKTGYVGVFGVAIGILALDFLMRLLIVEKKTAAKYMVPENDQPTIPANESDDREQNESDPLIRNPRHAAAENETDGDLELETYKVRGEPGRVARAFPVTICFCSPRLVVALLLALVQAGLLALFDATIPTEAKDLLGFSSLEAGLLFIAIDVPYLVLGPIAGWAVDRYGTKPAAVLGFAYLSPALALLRLPSERWTGGEEDRTSTVILYAALLALNGIGLAIISSPSLVEASAVVQRYERANPGFFGPNGPYAQLYGFNSVFFNLGLTIGPLAAGALRDSVGYGNMNLVFAAVTGITAVMSFFVIGGKPAILGHLKRGQS